MKPNKTTASKGAVVFGGGWVGRGLRTIAIMTILFYIAPVRCTYKQEGLYMGQVRKKPGDDDHYRKSDDSWRAPAGGFTGHPAPAKSGSFDSQYHDGGKEAGLTYGGDRRNWESPVHGTDSEGRDVTVSSGRAGSPREGDTLIADGHLTSQEFYSRNRDGAKNHDHAHGDGTYEGRGRYSG